MSYVQWLFEGLDYDQNKPIYIDANNPERSLSAAQTKSLVLKIGAGLQNFGVQKGDCTCVVSLNDVYYTPTYLGIIAAGGIFTGANPAYTVFEVAHHLRVCNAKFVIAEPQSLAKVREAAAEVGIPESNIIIFDVHHQGAPPGAKSFWDLIGDDEISVEDVSDSANVPASYISSSGTSGLPKAVVIPHAYLINQCQIQTERKMPYEVSRLSCLPPFPAYAAPSQHGMPLKSGSPCYVMPRYDGNSVLDAVEKYQITEVLLVPPMVLSLPLLPKCTSSAVASLRQVFCGGAAIAYHIQKKLYDILHPDARINQIFGMSECGWVCGFQYPEKDETSSVGRPLAGFTLKVVDEAGNDCLEDGQVGEIYIKPLSPMLRYLNNPTATAEAFAPGGWIRSGDIGYVKDSKWYVPDRKKDVIKVKGWQVSPTELESALLQHNDIIDAGVVGIPSINTFEDVPRGFVVRRPGSTITEGDVKVWMRGRLARYKLLDRVIFVTELPRNPTGKILRRLLKEGKYTEDAAAPGENIAIPEAAVEEVVIIENGLSNSVATGEQISAAEAVAQEVLVAEEGNSNPVAAGGNIAAPEAVVREIHVTENGDPRPVSAYEPSLPDPQSRKRKSHVLDGGDDQEHTAILEAIPEQIPVTTSEPITLSEAIVENAAVTEKGNSNLVPVSERIAWLEAIIEKAASTNNGTSSPAAIIDQIGSAEAIEQKVLVTENGDLTLATTCETAVLPGATSNEISTENGNTGLAATCENIGLPEAISMEGLVSENGDGTSKAADEQIVAPEAIAKKFATEGMNSDPTTTYRDIAFPEFVAEDVLATGNGVPRSTLLSEGLRYSC